MFSPSIARGKRLDKALPQPGRESFGGPFSYFQFAGVNVRDELSVRDARRVIVMMPSMVSHFVVISL